MDSMQWLTDEAFINSLILYLVPLTILAFALHIASLLVKNPVLNLWTTLLLYVEAVYEVASQVFLQNNIIISDIERDIAVIQFVSILTSIIVMSKTSIELLLSEIFAPEERREATLRRFNDDSMLKEKSLLQRLKLLVQFTPAFFTSLIIKSASISIISAVLRGVYSCFLYFGFWMPITFIFICYYFTHDNSQSALYASSNMVILIKYMSQRV